MEITIDINEKQIKILKYAFPEYDNQIEDIGKIIAQYSTDEFLELLAGTRRYMSLSHQYIEWISKLYELALPQQEFTYDRLYNNFNFPPGTAAYMARILRDRQNSFLHQRSLNNLISLFDNEIEEYSNLSPDEQVAQQVRGDLKLTHREFNILRDAVDRLIRDGEDDIEIPKEFPGTREYKFISYNIKYIKKAMPKLEELRF